MVTVTEYQQMCSDDSEHIPPKCLAIPATIFNSAKKLLKDQKTAEQYKNLFEIKYRDGIEILSAKEYVGTIAFKNGDMLEILPKTAREDEKSSRALFLKMLRVVYDVPYSSTDISKLDTERGPPFEIFIRMFLEEVTKLNAIGYSSTYNEISENCTSLKGRIDFPNHIKSNVAHRERFYVRYEEYNLNRPENRIIKSTLLLLSDTCTNFENRMKINALLPALDTISVSENYELDFQRIKTERGTEHYATALQWCQIFLNNKTLTTFSGQNIAYAYLFKMDRLFQDYVGKLIKKTVERRYKGYYVNLQQETSLFDKNSTSDFTIRPDIFIHNPNTNTTYIADTKWKLVNEKGYSIEDMYQMFAYSCRYSSEKTLLIYPKINEKKQDRWDYSKDSVHIESFFIDLLSDNAIDQFVNSMNIE